MAGTEWHNSNTHTPPSPTWNRPASASISRNSKTGFRTNVCADVRVSLGGCVSVCVWEGQGDPLQQQTVWESSVPLSLSLSRSGNCDASGLRPDPSLSPRSRCICLIRSANPSLFPSVNPSLPRLPRLPIPKTDVDLRAASLAHSRHTQTCENMHLACLEIWIKILDLRVFFYPCALLIGH